MFRISSVTFKFRGMRLISRSWSQKSSSMQVCTPFRHSLIACDTWIDGQTTLLITIAVPDSGVSGKD